jgi:hypothetical protein
MREGKRERKKPYTQVEDLTQESGSVHLLVRQQSRSRKGVKRNKQCHGVKSLKGAVDSISP